MRPEAGSNRLRRVPGGRREETLSIWTYVCAGPCKPSWSGPLCPPARMTGHAARSTDRRTRSICSGGAFHEYLESRCPRTLDLNAGFASTSFGLNAKQFFNSRTLWNPGYTASARPKDAIAPARPPLVPPGN